AVRSYLRGVKSRAIGRGAPSEKMGPSGPTSGRSGLSVPGNGKNTLMWSSKDADSKSCRSSPASVTRTRCCVTGCTRRTCSRRNLRGWRTRTTARSGLLSMPFSLKVGLIRITDRFAFYLGRGARKDGRDTPLFVGRRIGSQQQRALERTTRLDHFGQPAHAIAFIDFFAGKRAAH